MIFPFTPEVSNDSLHVFVTFTTPWEGILQYSIIRGCFLARKFWEWDLLLKERLWDGSLMFAIISASLDPQISLLATFRL